MKKSIKNITQKFCRCIVYTLVFACLAPDSFAQTASVAPVQRAQIKPIETTAEKKVSKHSEMALSQVVSPKPQNQVASLSFSWNIPVALSLFKRGDYLWIIFDHTQSIDIEELSKTAAPLSDEIVQIPNFQALILRLKINDNVKFMVRKEGLLWIVDLFTHDIPVQTKDMQVFTQYNSKKQPFLFIPVQGTGNIISTIDPEIGDSIITAPNMDIGIGLSHTYNYPDLELLQSYQGLVLVSKTNDILLNRATTGLTIQGYNRGLNVSHDLETLKRQELLAQADSELGTFAETVKNDNVDQNFVKAVADLRQDIADAPEEQKNKARLELAQYYVSKGLGTNALSILNKIKATDTPEAKSEKLYGLMGVANFLANRFEEAVENFSYGKLPQYNEAIFWRTLASSAIEYKDEDSGILLSFISLIRDYPDEVKDRIALVGARIALNAGDDLSAQNFIDILKNSKHPERLLPAVHYFTAQKLVLQGSPMSAIAEYKRILPMDSLKYSSFARKEIVDLGLRLSLYPLEKAIGELERLRYSWGEKPFKISVLSMLADLYIKKKDFNNALQTLQDLKNISDFEDKPLIEQRMVKLFEDIYINNEADNLPALKSLALYDDYAWLAPKSSRYNTIVQKLSDRLVAVDLLERADKLLTNQLKKVPMTQLDRSKIGTRLALIYLFSNKNEEALLMLDNTETPNMPETLSLQRKIIKAKALTNLGREHDALELLKDDYSKNAILLKSEIYWNAGLWGQASDNIKYLIEKPTPGKPLSEEQINYILDWATALKKSGKETVIVRLHNKFMPYFKNTKYHSVFNILTDSLEDDKIDINAINGIVNDVAAFSNFAKIYTNSLKTSDINKDTE